MARGAFITIEGGEGAGKSTQVRLLAARLAREGRDVVALHEPGGTQAGEAIRGVLLDPGETSLAPMSELLLFEAARAQLVSQVIRPALARGAVVVCDRFCDSTLAYQGYARGIPLDQIRALNELACGGLVPDRTILLDIDVREGLARARKCSGNGGDRMEREDIAFHQAVRDGFSRLAADDPDRFVTIRQAGTPEQVAEEVLGALADLLGPGAAGQATGSYCCGDGVRDEGEGACG